MYQIMNNMQLESDHRDVTNIVVNGNNDGSLTSNKEYHICYSVIENSIKNKSKKIIGCFINPNDLILETDKSKNIQKHIYYFQLNLPITKLFSITELLNNTFNSRNYSNHIAKKILKDGNDVTTKKIIMKCEEELKKKY
jgi:hypothetical protein